MTPRWMLFVDGENLTLRAQALVASMAKFSLPPGPLYREDVFVWLPRTACEHGAADLSIFHDVHLGGPPLRSIYYTSLVGDEETLQKVRTDLWTLEFQPEVFKKTARDQKAKGVDISLTKDMLSHAFLDNYDIAVLVAGDGEVPHPPGLVGRRAAAKVSGGAAGWGAQVGTVLQGGGA
ncbi:MAG: NYN domain-containing protein, partial [Acidobacteriota bacterium]